jgi:hypothetical protein
MKVGIGVGTKTIVCVRIFDDFYLYVDYKLTLSHKYDGSYDCIYSDDFKNIVIDTIKALSVLENTFYKHTLYELELYDYQYKNFGFSDERDFKSAVNESLLESDNNFVKLINYLASNLNRSIRYLIKKVDME